MFRLARDALATRDLRRLQFASLAAGVGGWAFMVSLAVHAYAVGGAAAVGLAAFVRMAPAGLAAPLTGLAADRFPRRDVLLAATLARALLLGAATLAVALDAPFALLLVLATLFTVAATAHKPAQAALLPHLAPSVTRQAASNAALDRDRQRRVRGGRDRGRRARGRPRHRRGLRGAGVAFVAAALALTRASQRDEGRVRDAPREAPRGRARRARRPARRRPRPQAAAARRRPLRLARFVEGMVDVLVVVVALKLVALGDAGVGWLNAAWGIGGLLGGAVALKLLARDQLRLALPVGGVLIGAPLVALAALPHAVAALLALTVLGVGYALTESAGITLMQRLAHDGVRARAFGVIESSYWLTTGAGAMLAPALVALVGPRGALRRRRRAAAARPHPRAALRRLAPAATGGCPAAASAPARPERAGARSPAAAPVARPVTPAARRS